MEPHVPVEPVELGTLEEVRRLARGEPVRVRHSVASVEPGPPRPVDTAGALAPELVAVAALGVSEVDERDGPVGRLDDYRVTHDGA